jgi:basic membrane protein A
MSTRSSIKPKIPLAAAVTAAACVLGVAACGGSSSPSGSASSSGTAASGKSNLKVALLTTGTPDDGSWGNAVIDGAKSGASKYGLKLSIADNINDDSTFTQDATAFASQGYNLIISGNGTEATTVLRLAKQYPTIKWAELAGTVPNPPANMVTVTPFFAQATFLAGYLAGSITKSGTVGAVGAEPFPALTSEMEGFLLGARYANPKVKTLQTYIGSYTDVSKGQAAAQQLASKGADVVLSATDEPTRGVIQAFSGMPQHYVIAQYFDKSSEAPKVILTSALYDLQGAIAKSIQLAATNTWHAGNLSWTVSNGVSLAPFHTLESAVPASVQKKLDQVRSDLESGKLVIPNLDVLGKVGAAAKIQLSSLQK